MKTCHDVAGRMIIKALGKSPWGAGLVNMDIGRVDRLAQHDLQIPAHASNRLIPPYLFPRHFSKRSRLTSSRPDAILITPHKAKPTPSCPSSTRSHHHALRSRHNPTLRTTTADRVRQPDQLNVNQRHVHLIEIKYCEDMRPGQHVMQDQRQSHIIVLGKAYHYPPDSCQQEAK
eukprot:1144059-Pelagomonas_calceolata.AAC.1